MNKTVNINIGGLFFHIDEDAYQKLSRYFDAIKRSLSNSSGKDEIMKDIEMRVAELFAERQKSDKHVINNKDVDEVVTVMGQPEDYRIDDDGTTQETNSNFATTGRKKLYRDKDRGLIGGVCTGLSYYTGIDAVWIKVIFILFTCITVGWGLLAYLILWIATPKAVTTSEKLEMRGEPVTISNIEKKVREEFDSVSEKIKNVNYDDLGNKVKSGAESVGSRLGDVFTTIFSAFAKVLGAIIVVISSISLLGICIASIVLMFSSSLPKNTIINHISTPIGLETPLWAQGILFLLAAGIPMFFFLILGLKLLVTNLRSIGNIAKYSLLAVWIIAVGILISIGINEATQIAYDGKDVKKETINLALTDTLFIKMKNNDFYSKDNYRHSDFELTQDENNNEVIYSNNVTIQVLKTDEVAPYIQVEKLAVGKTADEAKKRAEKIKYSYKIVGNQLILDNYLLTEVANKFRNQSVELFLYLPKGTILKVDETVQNFDRSDDQFFNIHYSSSNYIYKVGESQVKCLNCPADENEHGDVETEDVNVTEDNDSIKTISVKVNGKEVIQTTKGKPGSLTIDEHGIIIKTN
ncbi:MAG: PspC domain-containing protein [Flavobacteriaceae bacterium]|nr:PspC domain-containing protein [Flavobacteriaceae bacterium]